MRRFVVVAHKVPLSGEFSLNDLPGTGGRIDVLCRAVGSALFVSHGVRTDTEISLVIQDAVEIRIDGSRVKRLNPDERSTAAILQLALRGATADEVETTPGVVASQSTLAQVLDRLYQAEAHPIVLHEHGDPLNAASLPPNPAFILSDHEEFSDADEKVLSDVPHLSLGPTVLHTSQCITVVHYLLDCEALDVSADLVLCHKVWGEPKARLIAGLLEDFGIPSNLLGHAVPSLYPGMLDGLGEVRIMVRPRDLERARAIIGDYFEQPLDE